MNSPSTNGKLTAMALAVMAAGSLSVNCATALAGTSLLSETSSDQAAADIRVAQAAPTNANPAKDSSASSPGARADSSTPSADAGAPGAVQEERAASKSTTPTASPADGVVSTSDDGRINSQVKSKLAEFDAATNLKVSTANGVVHLAGSVPSREVANRAKKAAQEVSGVGHVDTSGLKVTPNK